MRKEADRPRLDGRSRAARRERGRSRERLLDAAVEVFATRGFVAATVDEIAAQAGLSKGAVYWNFESKEHLFAALREERIDARLREMIELLRAGPADQDMAPEASRRLLELVHQEPEMVLIANEHWALAARDPELRRRYAERSRELRGALASSLEARRRRLDAPELSMPSEEAATAFIALADGLSRARLIDREAVPDHLYGEIVSLVFQGLVARAERDARDRRHHEV